MILPMARCGLVDAVATGAAEGLRVLCASSARPVNREGSHWHDGGARIGTSNLRSWVGVGPLGQPHRHHYSDDGEPSTVPGPG